MKTKYDGLTILCNGCGQPLTSMGVWPVQYPRDVPNANTQFVTRYMCERCRTPRPDFAKGAPVGISIIETDLEGATDVEAA